MEGNSFERYVEIYNSYFIAEQLTNNNQKKEETNMEKWQLKILEGMKLIKEGCSENNFWACCNECPFTNSCDIIQKHAHKFPYTPEEWEIENLKY